MQMALEARSPAILRFGVFEVDLRAGEVRKQGVRTKLQEQPFHVLTVLLQRPGEVVTREELRSQNWPADTFVDFDNSLNTAINKLREALRSEEHTSELQSQSNLVCRLLLEKKKNDASTTHHSDSHYSQRNSTDS